MSDRPMARPHLAFQPFLSLSPPKRPRHLGARAWRGWCAVLLMAFSAHSHATSSASVSPDEQAAKPADQYYFLASPYTYHFSHNPEHKHVYLLGIERVRHSREVAGITFFSNSFGQPSVFVYPWGRVYSGLLPQAPHWYVKWAAGLLYGYRDPYEKKVPMNVNGFSPGFILALGRPVSDNLAVQLNLLGNSGLMLQASFRLP